MILEQQIVAEILAYLAGRSDVYAWRNNTGALRDGTGRVVRFGCPGSADIIGLLASGRFLAIEVKRKDGRVSDGQRAWGARIARLGGVYVVARSVADVAREIPPAN